MRARSLRETVAVSTFIARHRTVLGWGGAIAAAVIAVVYFFVLPAEAATSTGFARVILHFGHSLVWVLLCGAAISFALRGPKRLTAALAYAALASYAVFLVTMFVF